jgi:hypothetical protein
MLLEIAFRKEIDIPVDVLERKVEAFFARADCNGDGRISRDEFYYYYKTN